MKYSEEYSVEFVKSAEYLQERATELLKAQEGVESASPRKSILAAEIVGCAQAVHIITQISENDKVWKIATSMFSIASMANIHAANDCLQYDAFEDAHAHLEIAKQSAEQAAQVESRNSDNGFGDFLEFMKSHGLRW